jgi:transposase
MPNKELTELFGRTSSAKPAYTMPDYEIVHREMGRSGVTLQLLWSEYCQACHDAGEMHYQISQFKKYYHDYVIKTKATMHLSHRPSEFMEVDWAGSTCEIIDDESGEAIKAYVFVAILPYSMYTYVEAFPDQKQGSWIAAHVHAFTYFNGVPRILVPDNLKTGVTKNTKDELVLNETYQEMAE